MDTGTVWHHHSKEPFLQTGSPWEECYCSTGARRWKARFSNHLKASILLIFALVLKHLSILFPRGHQRRVRALEVSGLLPLVPLARQGAVQKDPTRWQPYLPNWSLQPCRNLQWCEEPRGGKKKVKKHSVEVSQDFQLFYTVSENGSLCTQLKKKEITSRGTAWQFARVFLFFFPPTSQW